MKIALLVLVACVSIWLPIAFMDAMLLQASIDALHRALPRNMAQSGAPPRVGQYASTHR